MAVQKKVTLTSDHEMFYTEGVLEEDAVVSTIDVNSLDLSMFEGLPVIVGHKDEFYKEDIIGRVINVSLEDNNVVGVLEFDPRIDAEKFVGEEVSITYLPNYDPITKIHTIKSVLYLAVVENGRCGSECIIENGSVINMPEDKELEMNKIDSMEDSPETETVSSSLEDTLARIEERLLKLESCMKVDSEEDEEDKEKDKKIDSSADNFDWCGMNTKIEAITGQRMDLDDFNGNLKAAMNAAVSLISKKVSSASSIKNTLVNSSAPTISEYKKFIDVAYSIHKEKMKEVRNNNVSVVNSAQEQAMTIAKNNNANWQKAQDLFKTSFAKN